MTISGHTKYKYRAYSARALEMLIRRELYFANPAALNDPYDCQINIRDSLASAIQQAQQLGSPKLHEALERFTKINHVYEKMDSDLVGMGILSLSRNPTNTLMWSHYADNHKGFCVGFQLSEKFTTHLTNDEIVGAIDVSYVDNNPYVDYFGEIAASDKTPGWEEFWVTLLSIGMVAKAKPWIYEEEVRVLRKSPGPVGFAAVDLTEIVFGLNMALSDRETLKTILSGAEWNHVRFREVIRSDGFALYLRDATQPQMQYPL